MTIAIGFRASVLLAAIGGLAACATSPPMRFYTLSVVSDPGAAAAAGAMPAIRVARVNLPGEIDRAELVQRIDANRLRLAENDRWAAPLGEMIRRTLSEDLRSRTAAATGNPDPLSVDIEEFIADADCVVTLRAAWSLEPSNREMQPARGYETIREGSPGACEVGVLPQVMSRALAELSNRIVSGR